MFYEFNGLKPIVHPSAFVHPQNARNLPFRQGRYALVTMCICECQGMV